MRSLRGVLELIWAHRVFLAVTWRVLLARILPAWIVLGACIAVLYPVLDFPLYGYLLSQQSPSAHALTWVVLLGGWSALMSRSVQVTAYGREVRWMWRLPVASLAWGTIVAPLAVSAALPPALVAVLRRDGVGVLELIAWLGLAVPMLVAAGERGLRGLVASAGGLAAVAVVAGVGQAVPALWYALTPACVITGLWTSGLLYSELRGRVGDRRSRRVVWRVRSPTAALIYRDWLCLWRVNRGLVLATSIATIGLAVIAIVLGRKGAETGATIWTVATIAAPLSGQIVGRLASTFGEQLFVGSWPTTTAMRLVSLLALASLPLLILVVAVAVVVGALSALGVVISLTLVLALVVGFAATSLWAAWRPNAPIYMLFGALFLLMSTLKYGPPALLIHIGVAGLGAFGAWTLLNRRRLVYE